MILFSLLLLLTSPLFAGDNVWTPIGAGTFSLGTQRIYLRADKKAEIFVADDGLGVFHSEDSGASFQPRNNGLSSLSIQALAIDPNQPGLLYAGATGALDATGGVYKSADNGLTWTFHGRGLTNLNVTAIAIDPSAGHNLYAGTTAGVFRSEDGGANWQTTPLNNVSVECLTVDPREPDVVLAGTTNKGVYRSINRGMNWTAVNEGLGDVRVLSIIVREDVTPTAFIGTLEGVYRRSNFFTGSTWAAVNDGLPTSADVYGLALDPLNPEAVYATAFLTPIGPITRQAVFTSGDNGNKWQALPSTGLDNPRITSIAFNTRDRRTIYVAAFGGSLYSLTLPSNEPVITPTPKIPDLNNDGIVDKEDLLIWQKTYAPDKE